MTTNTLEIKKEIKQVTFSYSTTVLKFDGTCDVTSEKKIQNVNSQIMLKDGSVGIGNATSNGSTSVNIWNEEYKQYIDSAAHDFKNLQSDLAEHYSAVIFNEEVL